MAALASFLATSRAAFAACVSIFSSPMVLGPLAAPVAQIIELGAPDFAAADDLDRIDHRRIDRKDALDAFAIGDLADGEALIEAAAVAGDADAFIGLNAWLRSPSFTLTLTMIVSPG